jgi:hypothetical protein
MMKLVNSLTPEQKSTTFSILKQIGSIVAPTVDSSRLTKPPEEPSAVQAARVKMLQKRREDSEAASQRQKDDVSSAIIQKSAPERQVPKDQEEQNQDKSQVQRSMPKGG